MTQTQQSRSFRVRCRHQLNGKVVNDETNTHKIAQKWNICVCNTLCMWTYAVFECASMCLVCARWCWSVDVGVYVQVYTTWMAYITTYGMYGMYVYETGFSVGGLCRRKKYLQQAHKNRAWSRFKTNCRICSWPRNKSAFALEIGAIYALAVYSHSSISNEELKFPLHGKCQMLSNGSVSSYLSCKFSVSIEKIWKSTVIW